MYKNKFYAGERNKYIKEASEKRYDAVIIGGGITGAGVARELALRGKTFCLIEKDDIAFGTSSRSSKLFHGGMRYLSQAEFGLVRESTTERNWLMHHFPNLVRPLGFMYCSYKNGKDKPYVIKTAVKLYDILSNGFSKFKNYRKAKIFKPAFVEEFEPAVAQNERELGKLKMAGFYYDTNCDDSRVTLEIVKESLELSQGKSNALLYCEVASVKKGNSGRAQIVEVKDKISGESFNVKADAVVSATGIWTDELLEKCGIDKKRIYPTKGVHVIVPNRRLGNRNAFGLRSFDDGRFFFVLRRGDVSVIGTTDTDYYKESKNLNEPWCKKEDADYLLRTVNRIFPHAYLTYYDIIGTYAGIRPLIKSDNAKSESDVSRTHEIIETEDGLVAIAGGKSTTHRLMAEEVVFYLEKKKYISGFSEKQYYKKGFSKQKFLAGLSRDEFDEFVNMGDYYNVVGSDQLDHFYQQYGRGAFSILKDIKSNEKNGRRLLESYPYCKAEFDYILENESPVTLSDLLCRRTEAQWLVWHYLQKDLADKAANIMAEKYEWSEAEKEKQIEDYMQYVRKTVEFIS